MRDRDDEADLDEDDDVDEDDDSATTMPCPACFATIYDDAERCPDCGRYLATGDLPRRPPWWVVMGVSVCLVIVARWIVVAR